MIKVCRICGSKKLKKIISLGNVYLSDFGTGKKPEKFPLTLILCENCSLLQLSENTPQSSLYTERYGYKSGINNTMKKELGQIVKKSCAFLKNKKGITTVDVGANDGTLLSNYSKSVFRIGVEPIRKFAIECKKNSDLVINDFFSLKSFKKKAKDKKADLITAISCFYDIPDPNQFISDISHILKKDGIFIIQQNYLLSMLQQNAFDNIVHEHLEYYSLTSLENLLEKHNLEVFKVELSDINGGSFRTYIAFKGERRTGLCVKRMREQEKKAKLNQTKTYLDFAKRVENNKEKLRKFIINKTKQGKKVYIYGASTRGNTLLQYFNLDNKMLNYAVERNPEKWGKKILSLNIPIISEEQARIKNPDYMLVLPWFFKKEFLQREKDYLKKGGHFIFPLPKFEVV